MNNKSVLNDVDENNAFTSLYTKLYNENFEELEQLRKEKQDSGIAFMISFFAIMAIIIMVPVLFITQTPSRVFFMIMFGIIGIIIVGAIIMFTVHIIHSFNKEDSIKGKSYEEVFKEKIVVPIIKSIIPHCEYFPNQGMTEEQYARGDWERYDRYSSEDKIILPIKLVNKEETKLYISEVHTEDRHKDEEGNVSYSTLFHGMCGYVELSKSLNGYIKIQTNGTSTFSNNRLEMDMSEFEKVFDVETDDKIKAMQILTSDVMYDMLDMVNKYETKFEIYLQDNVMHIRFYTGSMYEPEIFSKSMQLDKLKEYFDLTAMIEKVTTDICDIILGTEF